MKKYLTVLRFELESYLKNKSYLITTILISLALIIGLSIPNIISHFTTSSEDKSEKSIIMLYDENKVLREDINLGELFPDMEFLLCDSYDELKEKVQSDEADAGFLLKSLTQYTYMRINI